EWLELSMKGQNQETPFKLTNQQLLNLIRLFLRAHKETDRAISLELPLLLASLESSIYLNPQNKAQTQSAPAQVTDKKKAQNSFKVDQNNFTSAAASQIVEQNTKTAETFEQQQNVAARLETSDELVIDSQVSESDMVGSPPLDSQEVSTWWIKLVGKVREVNSPLATLLKNSPIDHVNEDSVVVKVRYLFHKENLENTKNYNLITTLASEFAGRPIGFKAVIKKDDQKEPLPNQAVLTDAIKLFGGELVD
ncbi:MAG: hypothetical protein R3B41_03355, partial [Candidatus Doudnabacteria bacterium]